MSRNTKFGLFALVASWLVIIIQNLFPPFGQEFWFGFISYIAIYSFIHILFRRGGE